MIALAGENLLEQLDEPTRAWLAKMGQRRSYADRELIHNRGDTEPAMAIVISGQVQLCRIHADGANHLVSVVQPGQHYGDIVMFGRRKRTHDAVALGETTIDHYDHAAFEMLLGHISVVRALYHITALRLNGSLAMSDDLRSLPREVHLAKLLLHQWRQGGGLAVIPCTQEDLAGLLGTSVMSMSKYLSALKREGLIETGYRQVVLHDPQRLKQWVRERLAT
ncbi:MAG: Crp/Fnr family transcriptional regulator [Novosphingobium sp.]|nr:Crp/Fnr family transcriptional regulator [Novosphingobium sp.]